MRAPNPEKMAENKVGPMFWDTLYVHWAPALCDFCYENIHNLSIYIIMTKAGVSDGVAVGRLFWAALQWAQWAWRPWAPRP